MKSLWVIVLTVTAGMISGAGAQTAAPAAQHAQVAGTVASVDAAGKKLTVKTDKGETVTLATNDHTFFRRLPAGEADMKKALSIAFGDIVTGDQIVASYQTAADKTLEARTVLIRTKSDLDQIRDKELQDWKTRGTVGNVASVDAAANTFTIKSGPRVLTVKPTDKTDFMRYAPDSAKIEDAKPSSLAQIKVGDQAHVLGNKNADGTTITAEKVVFGSFKQIAATIEAVDVQTGELRVKDLAVKKGPPVILKVNADTTLKKLPSQLAAMLARRYAPGAQQGEARGGSPMGPGNGGFAGGPGGRGQGGMGGGRGGFDSQRMLESVPATPLADLKPGDAIMVSTTEGSDSTHMTAIMLLAGVEDVLRAAPNSTRDIMAGWNLGGGGGGDQ